MDTEAYLQRTKRVCDVFGCGAHVFVIKTKGEEIAVDIRPLRVVVPLESAEEFGLMTGYLPHANSCLDISNR